MKTPSGFLFSGLNSGVKANRKDLALVYSEAPCAAAACLTVNKAKAAPVLELEGRVPLEGVRAVVINSGNANALTGDEGVRDVQAVKRDLGAALKVSPEAVLTASTGVIGVRLPTAKLSAAMPGLVAGLRPEPEAAAEAIMTTDTRIKMAHRTIELGGRDVVISAICKGSGMIAPQLATTIAVIVTDADLSPAILQGALREAMRPSFNSLTVDNDMSTNDVIFALANGRAGNARITDPGEDLSTFTEALTSLCQELAREVAADGEGATRLLEITVENAPTFDIAQDLARSIAGSSLVKAAIFGADPNWGRVLATVGARAGSQGYASVDPYTAKVTIQEIVVYDRGPAPHETSVLKAKMRSPEVKIRVDLGAGSERCVAWGCDLSYDYVKINADYTSLLVNKPDGGVAKDNRLTNYSPAFKVSLLVEALSYISRFEGKRCVIKYGGAGMVKDSLKKAFCDDINLLRSVGMKPIVVHGGAPEISRTLEKLGSNTDEFIDGMRITNASDQKVVEMVLSGAVNTELVTLLNREGAHAVGVSGKDGALLRAKKRVDPSGRDLGQTGVITGVNKQFLEMLLQQDYVPVVSPIGLGEDGQGYNLHGDDVASAIAVAVGASKLIYLTDTIGVLQGDELMNELTSHALREQLERGSISGGMQRKVQSILAALAGGVERAHVIDGRVPHTIIGELFTDRGVGTLVTP